MKSTWFACPRRAEFAKLIHAADNHRRNYEVFESFLHVAAGSLRQGVHKFCTGSPDDAIEQEVIRQQKQLKDPAKLSDAMGVLVEALTEREYDFLGTVMSELEVNDASGRGQVFTPPELATVMARMTLQEISVDPAHRLTLNEPCVGGGSILIATSLVLKEKGFFPWNYWWLAQDIDWRCVCMTYIQTTLLAIPAVVVLGDTLAVEARSAWPTMMAAMYPLRESQRRDSRPEAEAAVATESTDDSWLDGLLEGVVFKACPNEENAA